MAAQHYNGYLRQKHRIVFMALLLVAHELEYFTTEDQCRTMVLPLAPTT